MIHLGPNEKVLMTIHRHWIAIIGKVIAYILILFFPFVVAPALIKFGIPLTIGSSLFFFIIYLMIIILGLFVVWVEYYLDVWIITTDRVIDINQKSLFNREISEFVLKNIQDVTIDVPGLLATFLKYGNITVQTAGEASFTIQQAPNVYKVKDLILDYSRLNQNNN
ncbi:MAG: PH domain-containing protein [Patescibacteria group bacterium]